MNDVPPSALIGLADCKERSPGHVLFLSLTFWLSYHSTSTVQVSDAFTGQLLTRSGTNSAHTIATHTTEKKLFKKKSKRKYSGKEQEKKESKTKKSLSENQMDRLKGVAQWRIFGLFSSAFAYDRTSYLVLDVKISSPMGNGPNSSPSTCLFFFTKNIIPLARHWLSFWYFVLILRTWYIYDVSIFLFVKYRLGFLF
jgi:hypothetical protein